MKAVTPDPALVQRAGQGEAGGDLGHRAVKRGVEAADLRHLGIDRKGGAHRGKIVRLVQRGERRKRVEPRDPVRIELDRGAVIEPAVNDPVADRGQRQSAPRFLDPAEDAGQKVLVS